MRGRSLRWPCQRACPAGSASPARQAPLALPGSRSEAPPRALPRPCRARPSVAAPRPPAPWVTAMPARRSAPERLQGPRQALRARSHQAPAAETPGHRRPRLRRRNSPARRRRSRQTLRRERRNQETSASRAHRIRPSRVGHQLPLRSRQARIPCATRQRRPHTRSTRAHESSKRDAETTTAAVSAKISVRATARRHPRARNRRWTVPRDHPLALAYAHVEASWAPGSVGDVGVGRRAHGRGLQARR